MKCPGLPYSILTGFCKKATHTAAGHAGVNSIFQYNIHEIMAALSLRVLVDNTTLTDRYFQGEPGFSCFLSCGNKRILFDTGYSDAFLTNAGRMGINLLELEYVVLSHGHIDHTGGMAALLKAYLEASIEERPHRTPSVIAHPHCFYPRPVPSAGDVGCPVDETKLLHRFPVMTSTKPFWLNTDLVFLGEIDRISAVIPDREKRRTVVTPDGPQDDKLLDDSALVYVSDAGLVIVTGCTHAGVPNLVEHAKKVTGEDRIRDIIGGFHLKESDIATMSATVEYLHEIRPAALHPCHCTSLAAKIALSAAAPVRETGVGLLLEY